MKSENASLKASEGTQTHTPRARTTHQQSLFGIREKSFAIFISVNIYDGICISSESEFTWLLNFQGFLKKKLQQIHFFSLKL